MNESELDVIFAAEQTQAVEYQGKKVTLNQPRRIGKGDPGYGKKKFYVYVKNDRGNVVRVMFGDPNMEIRRDDPQRRKNYRSRHGCSNPGPKWKANYWSCKMWEAKKSVTQYTSSDIFNRFIKAIKDDRVIDVVNRCEKSELRRYVPQVYEDYLYCLDGVENFNEEIHLTTLEMQEIVCIWLLFLKSQETNPENYGWKINDYLKKLCELTRRPSMTKQKIINWARDFLKFVPTPSTEEASESTEIID
jgi:hypothetical protein